MASPGLPAVCGRCLLVRMHATPLSWGILGTGAIAHTFARALAGARAGRLVAVASRGWETAARFAAEVGCPRWCASYPELIVHPEVEAVYVATPHPAHLEWALAAIRAGKHVLCEKPLTLNRRDAARVIAAARAAQVTLMEAYMYRCHPQTSKLLELVRSGVIGRIGVIRASFGFRMEPIPGHRLFSRALGGGAILDVGGYPVSMARLLAGADRGMSVAEPRVCAGAARLDEREGIDLHASASLDFGGGLVAQIACGIGLELENAVQVFGTEGSLRIDDPWFAAAPAIVVRRRPGGNETIEIPVDRTLYAYEADAFAEAVRADRGEVSSMSWDDTLGNMAVLDAWRAQAGVADPDPPRG